MNVRCYSARLCGTVDAPSSKSDAHRLLIAAALGDCPAEVGVFGISEDIAATARCLAALGAGICQTERGYAVSPIQDPSAMPLLDCGESGSTLRFLAPVAAALRGARLTGHGRLGQRPMQPLISALCTHGCTAQGWPLEVSGGLKGGAYRLPGDVSSQYLTGLLLALPLCGEESVISLETPLQSRGYVDMTLRTLRRFGIAVHEEESGWRVPGGQRYQAPQSFLAAEGDWSNAAFWLAANALGGSVTVRGLCESSAQGDRAIARLSQKLPRIVDVSDIPDLAPILSVLAAARSGETRLTGTRRLRLKESDRVAGIAMMLRALGCGAEALDDALLICGGGLRGGVVDALGDHRLAMSAAIAACACEGSVTILGAQAVNKSYPAFFADYQALGGKCDVL